MEWFIILSFIAIEITIIFAIYNGCDSGVEK